MKKIFEVFALVLFSLLLLSGPIALIIAIVTKNMMFLDIFCVYAVVIVTACGFNSLATWADSLGKKQ